MDRIQLLPMVLPPASSINGNPSGKAKMSFVRRLALGCVVLAFMGLLYVPAYHSVQGPSLGIGETSSSVGSSGGLHFLASVVQLPGWAYNTSRNLNSYIHPDNVTTILSPLKACNPVPYLLIIVCSATENLDSRMAIRSTWAKSEAIGDFYKESVKVAFLLGQSDNDTINNSIIEESLQYNDIIQEKFLDTYNNLTLKSAMMLKWATNNCMSAKYLMKTDDDIFVNVPSLLKMLKARPQVAGTLVGSIICKARPITDPKNKWYTPKYMFSERTYPNYLSGTGYVMSLDVAKKLYVAALSTPLFHLEDVYVTGICARSSRLRPTNHPGFSYLPRKLDFCVLNGAMMAHKVNATIMHAMWNKIRSSNATSCPEHPEPEKKLGVTNKNGRNIGYFLTKRKRNNRCD